MNLNTIQAKNKTEDLLLSITKYCEILIKQTHRKSEETLEFKITKSRETFFFKSPISIEGSSKIGLTSLELYKFIFIINHKNNKLELYADTFDEFSFGEIKGKLEEIINISKISREYLEDGIIGPRIISAYRKLETEKRRSDGSSMLLMGYARP